MMTLPLKLVVSFAIVGHSVDAFGSMPTTGKTVPDTIVWRGASLAARRFDTSPATAEAVTALLKEAADALAAGPFAVTDKTLAPPSGSKHDYWSVASYFWPCNVPCNTSLWSDCSRWCMPPKRLLQRHCVAASPKDNTTCDHSTGLPWTSHDGYPREHDQTGKYLKGDRSRADGVTLNTAALALAWWFAEPGAASQYAERAALLLRTFFLNETTRMNPNMKYAQGVPGRFAGGVGGTVDFGRLWMLLDAVRLLETEAPDASPWTYSDRRAFRAWVVDFLEWWVGSEDGQQARQFKNNIGTAYDMNALAMATFVGNASLAADLVNKDVRGRVDLQIRSTGALPMEDGRSNSFGYHAGDLLNFLDLAAAVNASVVLAQSRGVSVDKPATDLLRYVSPNSGGSVHKALDWFAPFCEANATNWPFPMTNNSGEEIQTYLPRCREIYSWASLLFTPEEGSTKYEKVAASCSSAADPYRTGSMSTLDWITLLFSK